MVVVEVSDGRGTIVQGPGTIGTSILDKDYPYEEGLSGAVTKQTGSPNL